MMRLKVWLLNALTALSLLLLAVTVVLCIRSFSVQDVLIRNSWQHASRGSGFVKNMLQIDSASGGFDIHRSRILSAGEWRSGWVRLSYSNPGLSPRRISYLLPVLVMLLLPMRAARGYLRRRRAARRIKRGECAACGYDLRATTGVCPECGVHAEVKG